MRKLLRDATHHHHVLLNRHPLLLGLTRPDLNLSVYCTLLTAYFRIYQKIEDRIDQFLAFHPAVFDYTARQKLTWLRSDLEYFGVDLNRQRKIPCQMAGVPEIMQIGHLAGVLYAIEGSTLGGQYISSCLSKHHGLSIDRGARFFNGYGERTQNMWQEFLGFSESLAGDTVQCQSAEKAACQTFRFFNEVFDMYIHSSHHKELGND